ncbi:MAG: hypothetical protein R6U44_07510 [Archaeoglobaceae archaeon]
MLSKYGIGNEIEFGSGELVALTAPPDMVVELICSLKYGDSGVNRNDSSSMLYIPGNSSVVLPGFNRIKIDLEVRRSFTVYQLMQVLEEAHQSIVFVEYDVELWEDVPSFSSTGVLEALVWRMKELTQQGTSVVIYAPRMNALDSLSRYVDRVVNVDHINKGFAVRDSSTGNKKLVNNQNRSLSDFYG